MHTKATTGQLTYAFEVRHWVETVAAHRSTIESTARSVNLVSRNNKVVLALYTVGNQSSIKNPYTITPLIDAG